MAITIIKIGSHPNNDVVIQKEGISEYHARISINDDKEVFITNVDLAEGSYVNGSIINGLKPLYAGDALRFGDVDYDWENELAEHIEGFVKKPKPKPQIEEPNFNPQANEYVRPKGEDLLDDLEPDLEENDNRIPPPEDAGAIGQLIHQIKYPKDRTKQHRLWIMVIAIIMLLSVGLPYLFWFNDLRGFSRFPGQDEPEALSGIDMFLELISLDTPESFSVAIRYMLYVAGIPIVTICSVGLFFIGINVWKPQTPMVVKGLSLSVILTMGAMVGSQMLWYIGLLDDQKFMSGGGDAVQYLSFEYHGAGFWLSFIGSVLIFRSVNNKLWQPDFSRKWITLSASFWIPFVMLLASSSAYFGFMSQEIDMGKFNSSVGPSASMNSLKVEEDVIKTEQSGALLLSGMYYIKFIEWSKEEKEFKIKAKKSKYEERADRMSNIGSLLLFGFNVYFICVIMLMFSDRLLGVKKLALAISSLFALGLIYLGLNSWIDLQTERQSSLIVTTITIGIGFYIALLANIGMIVELIVLKTKKTKGPKIDASF